METDKAAVDVPSPVDGVVQELHAEVGEMVQTGEVLITIAEEGDAETADAAASDTTTEPGADTEEAHSAACEAAAATSSRVQAQVG